MSFIFRQTHMLPDVSAVSPDWLINDNQSHPSQAASHDNGTQMQALLEPEYWAISSNHILRRHSYMPCRTARNNVNLAVFLNLFLCNINIRKDRSLRLSQQNSEYHGLLSAAHRSLSS